MTTFSWGKTTRLISLAIRVKDRDKMIEFYRILGFSLKREENELAIMGTQKKGSELLLLEESPRANAYEGEIRKLYQATLLVSGEEELGQIRARLQKAEIPVIKELSEEDRVGFVISDPEGNVLAVCYKPSENAVITDRVRDEASSKDTEEELCAVLSPDVYFDRIKLNVLDMDAERAFLQDIVGFTFENETMAYEHLEQGRFEVDLHKTSGKVLSMATYQVHGLDFLRFTVGQADFDAFVSHLNDIHQEHYVDGKKSIITIYGPVGVEWWFVKEK